MIVNVRLDISDEDRQRLASRIAGRPIKGLVKRREVVAFVEGCLAKACADQQDGDSGQLESLPSGNLSAAELAAVERLREEGHDDGYITGWLIAGRPAGASRPRL